MVVSLSVALHLHKKVVGPTGGHPGMGCPMEDDEREQHHKVKLIFCRLSMNLHFQTSLIERVQREMGVDEVKAFELVSEYNKFMSLKAAVRDFDAKDLSPSAMIDEVWHLHILDTKGYKHFCESILFKGEKGIFIHHNPDGGIDIEGRIRRLSKTWFLYTKAFVDGKPSAEVMRFWEQTDEDDDDVSGGSVESHMTC